MRVFVDTNLWIYRFDRREPEKTAFEREWLRLLAGDHEIVINTQVMIEFRSVATRKFVPPLPDDDLRLALELLARFDVAPAQPELVLDAHGLAVSEKLSWLDALIVEAAARAHCDKLYSEDLDYGRRFGTMTVVHPFRENSRGPP